MTTPFWTQADIDALKAAIAGGVLTVSYDVPPRRSMTYQSLSEMLRLLADMRRDVEAAAGTGTTHRYAETNKGFGGGGGGTGGTPWGNNE